VRCGGIERNNGGLVTIQVPRAEGDVAFAYSDVAMCSSFIVNDHQQPTPGVSLSFRYYLRQVSVYPKVPSSTICIGSWLVLAHCCVLCIKKMMHCLFTVCALSHNCRCTGSFALQKN